MSALSKNFTVAELITAAVDRARHTPSAQDGAGGREVAHAITSLEQAQMWFTRGLAIRSGNFAPADLED